MRVEDFTWRPPVTIDCAATIADAAKMLAAQGVGALIVLDDARPVGVVTDRDLVTRCLAVGLRPDARVDAVMSMGVMAIDRSDDLDDLFHLFSTHAIRRVAVVEHDRVVGVISLDDVLVSTADNLSIVANVLSAQIMFPHAADGAPVPVVPG